jgi:hypothetical protein
LITLDFLLSFIGITSLLLSTSSQHAAIKTKASLPRGVGWLALERVTRLGYDLTDLPAIFAQ